MFSRNVKDIKRKLERRGIHEVVPTKDVQSIINIEKHSTTLNDLAFPRKLNFATITQLKFSFIFFKTLKKYPKNSYSSKC